MKYTKTDPSFLAVVAFALLTCAPQAEAERTVIHNVHVLPMTGAALLLHQSVVVEDGLITELGGVGQVAMRSSDRSIDGQGGYLIPGLIDAHVHIDHPQDLAMYPLFGVTTVVNMRGLPWHLREREVIRGGAFGPDFITAGDYLDGNPPNMLPMLSAVDVMSARTIVRQQVEAGYDFIKVYSELSREQYRAICAEARELGVAVVGHIPDAISLADLLECPHRNIAHGEQALKLVDADDAERVRSFVEQAAAAGLTLTANLALQAELPRQRTDLEALIAKPGTGLLHPATLQPWRPGVNRYSRRDEAWAKRVRESIRKIKAVVRTAGSSHPPLLVAGSDSPVAGAYPGSSLIEDVIAYQQAGLDSATALATATTHAAMLVRRLSAEFPQVGSVKVGHRADLVLLDRNPLEDLRALYQPRGVMLRGEWWDARALEVMRAFLTRQNLVLADEVIALEQEVFSGNLDAATARFRALRAIQPEAILFSQYPFFFVGFRWLYGEEGLTTDSVKAAKAVMLYDMYQQTYPEFHSSHHVYGLALEAAGDVIGAGEAQRRALEIAPDHAPAKEALARLHDMRQ